MEDTRTQNPEPGTGPRSGPSFITGISGFVGHYLAQQLADKGEEVSGIDLGIPPVSSAYSFSSCDILDFEKLEKIIAEYRPSFVYHLAGLTHPGDSLARPRDYYLVNTQGTVNLLEALRRSNLEARILIVSSSKVYGSVPAQVDRIDETLAPSPQTPYAMSKYLAEQAALQYFHNFETQVLIARPFNHTGPGQPSGFVVPDFCKQIAAIEALPPEEQTKNELRVGDLSAVLDLLDVRDVVQSYVELAKGGSAGQCYNICSGWGVPLEELLDLIIEVSGTESRPAIRAQGQAVKSACRHVGDNSKLKETTAWKTGYSLKDTLRDTLQFWRNALSGQSTPR